jgi:hypothetical protein
MAFCSRWVPVHQAELRAGDPEAGNAAHAAATVARVAGLVGIGR